MARLLDVMHRQHGPYSHVELVFRLPCCGDASCPDHRKALDAAGRCRAARPHRHRFSYSTSWTEGGVYETIDRVYLHTRHLWDVQRLSVPSDIHLQAMVDFARSQRGRRFGVRNMIHNFTVGWLYLREPVSFQRLQPRGPQRLPAAPLRREKKWFCSEFVTAALVLGGVIQDDQVQPSQTSPQLLCHAYKHYCLDHQPVALSSVSFL